MGSRENRLAVDNDDMNRAIILTWSNRSDGGVVLSLYQREQLERIVGEMAMLDRERLFAAPLPTLESKRLQLRAMRLDDARACQFVKDGFAARMASGRVKQVFQPLGIER